MLKKRGDFFSLFLWNRKIVVYLNMELKQTETMKTKKKKQKNPNRFVLYMHTRKTDGGIFYIGIGDKKRPKDKTGRNDHWYNTVNLYGYDVTILIDGLTWERACELEIMMIAFYGRRKPNPKNPNYGCLVNWTDGGEGSIGVIVSDKRKNELSIKMKGNTHALGNKLTLETREKISYALTQRVRTEETREKQRIAAKNRKPISEETREKQRNKKLGQNSPTCKLTEEDVLWIRNNYKSRDKVFGNKAMQKKFGVGKLQISLIVNNKAWTHV